MSEPLLLWREEEHDGQEDPLPSSPTELVAFRMRAEADSFLVAQGTRACYSICGERPVVLTSYSAGRLVAVSMHFTLEAAQKWAEGMEEAWRH